MDLSLNEKKDLIREAVKLKMESIDEPHLDTFVCDIIFANDIKMLDFLLYLNLVDDKNDALFLAARAGNLEAVKLLIVAGADINYCCEDSFDASIVEEALDNNHFDVASYLFSLGAKNTLLQNADEHYTKQRMNEFDRWRETQKQPLFARLKKIICHINLKG